MFAFSSSLLPHSHSLRLLSTVAKAVRSGARRLGKILSRPSFRRAPVHIVKSESCISLELFCDHLAQDQQVVLSQHVIPSAESQDAIVPAKARELQISNSTLLPTVTDVSFDFASVDDIEEPFAPVEVIEFFNHAISSTVPAHVVVVIFSQPLPELPSVPVEDIHFSNPWVEPVSMVDVAFGTPRFED